MEVLSFAGIPTMLFMNEPTPEMVQQNPEIRAIGIAGIARSKDPDWMRGNLPSAFNALKSLDAPVVHYKVCSTFDSSPDVGSIGAATDIGADVFDSDWIPLVVGAPAINRYQAFGNLFAGAGEVNHRLDRHPVMSRHPVTPMSEADLGNHLSHQTERSVGVVDLAAMKSGRSDTIVANHQAAGDSLIAIDVVDDETVAEAGRLIWRDGKEPVFAVGSQGVEYALVAHWRALGLIPSNYSAPALKPVEQLFAVSGSCAPSTADQIAYADNAGFEIIDFDAATAVADEEITQETNRVSKICERFLKEGKDVLVTTSRGPRDPDADAMNDAIRQSGEAIQIANERLGEALGNLVLEVRRKSRLPRVAIGGGDTSGYALMALGAESLTAVAPLAPGAPLCRVGSYSQPETDGLEVTLKGGQMGAPSFFVDAKGQHNK